MRDEVCVVGGGGAGLAAAWALRERRLPFRLLEAQNGVGGMWRHGTTFAYDGLESNTSRYRTSYRSYRMSRRGKAFVHHTEFLAYLEGFAHRFGLMAHVDVGARVVSARPLRPGWRLTVEGREPEEFRSLVVATGGLGKPRRRDIPGTFAGRRLHSGEYRSPAEFAGQDVVITGIGTSALEIGGELAPHARSVTLAVRSGVHFGPKRLFGVPVDLLDTRLSVRLAPFSVRRRVLGLTFLGARRAGRRHGVPAPDHRILDEQAAASDLGVAALRAGRLLIRPGVERLDGSRVVFTDGTSAHADALIEASGFDPDFSFLPDDLVDGYGHRHMPLYRGIAHTGVRDLYFVGFVSAAGALLPMFEAQARWIAATIAGDLPWPAPNELQVQMADEARTNQRDFGRPHTYFRDRRRYILWLEREVRAAGG